MTHTARWLVRGMQITGGADVFEPASKPGRGARACVSPMVSVKYLVRARSMATLRAYHERKRERESRRRRRRLLFLSGVPPPSALSPPPLASPPPSHHHRHHRAATSSRSPPCPPPPPPTTTSTMTATIRAARAIASLTRLMKTN